MKRTVSAIMLSLLVISTLTLAFNIQPVKAGGTVGVKAGDWIKYDYIVTGWPAGTPYPLWLKVEFLSVEGTSVTVRVTMRMSDGTEQNATVPVDVVAGGQAFGLSGLVIPANLTTGDTVFMSGYGNVTIAGETTRTYAGASRTVVYASFSQYGTLLTYYWDKLTGVMVEASVTSGDLSATAKATETNMWQSETIYIRADGSIDPPTAPISTFDNVTYTLTGNIISFADGIIVERDNIVIDGAGYTVEGPGSGTGISLSGRSNVSIKNTDIKDFWGGIIIYSSSNITIIRNNVTYCEHALAIGDPYGKGASNNVITENNMKYWEWGLRLGDSSNNMITRNNITGLSKRWKGSNGVGVSLYECHYNIITQNSIQFNQEGLTLGDSHFNSITQNNITDNEYGVKVISSSLNVIIENNITNNNHGIEVGGGYPAYRNAIFHNNLMDNHNQVKTWRFPDNAWDIGYPSGGNYWSDYNGSDLLSGPYQNETGSDGIGDIPYVIDENNMDKYPLMEPWSPIPTVVIYIRANGSIDPADAPIRREGDIYTLTEDIYASIVVERDNVVVDGAGYSLRGTGALDSKGIFLNETNNVTIKNVEIRAFYTGIAISDSSNNKLYRNNIADNLYAIRLYESSNNSVVGSKVTANIFMGIWLEDSSDCWISGNNIANNRFGLLLAVSSRNTIHGNDITKNIGYGIALSDSSNSNISENTVKNSYYGISLWSSSYSNIYHNNFINNTWQAQVYGNSSANIWDNGYPSGGNHWSDYTDIDIYSGPYQNETSSDGIGDTAYQIDADNRDRYPLIGPFNTFYAGAWNGVSYNVDIISNSTVSGFQFDVNQKSIIFNVTGYYGTTGFCRVTIPNDLLWADDGWTITVGDQQITDYRIISDGDFTYIYFSYNHSTKRVVIQGTHVIPEFPSATILPLFMVFSAISIVFAKKKHHTRKANNRP